MSKGFTVKQEIIMAFGGLAAAGIAAHGVIEIFDKTPLYASRTAVVAGQELQAEQATGEQQQIKAIMEMQDFLSRKRSRLAASTNSESEEFYLSEKDLRIFLNLNQLVHDENMVFNRTVDSKALLAFIDQAQPVVDGMLLQLLQQSEQQQIMGKKSKVGATFPTKALKDETTELER